MSSVDAALLEGENLCLNSDETVWSFVPQRDLNFDVTHRASRGPFIGPRRRLLFVPFGCDCAVFSEKLTQPPSRIRLHAPRSRLAFAPSSVVAPGLPCLAEKVRCVCRVALACRLGNLDAPHSPFPVVPVRRFLSALLPHHLLVCLEPLQLRSRCRRPALKEALLQQPAWATTWACINRKTWLAIQNLGIGLLPSIISSSTSLIKGLPYFATVEEVAVSRDDWLRERHAEACEKARRLGEPFPQLPAMNFPRPGEQQVGGSQPRITASGPGPHEKPANSVDAVGVCWNCRDGAWNAHLDFDGKHIDKLFHRDNQDGAIEWRDEQARLLNAQHGVNIHINRPRPGSGEMKATPGTKQYKRLLHEDGYVGVYRAGKKFQAQYTLGGKKVIYIGCFDSASEAALAYDNKMRELRRDCEGSIPLRFFYLNFPQVNTCSRRLRRAACTCCLRRSWTQGRGTSATTSLRSSRRLASLPAHGGASP